MRRAAAAVALMSALVVGPLTAATPAGAAPGDPLVTATSYRNPVSRTFADTFADPATIRGKDGWWYAYGTTDPLREGDTEFRRIPIARSRDLVRWTYVGDAFTTANRPRWAAAESAQWAPDIRYVNGQYRMYYVVTNTTLGPEDHVNDNAIGMATAPTPVGPWTDSGAPVVGPRPGGAPGADNYLWTFDPSAVTERDGSQWLFYGSYYGGVYVQRLTADGTRVTGAATRVGIDNKFEGAYAVRRGGYWYLFASTANCCAGPTTGYSVQVGRSRSITGPYLDRDGVPLTASRTGGTPTLVQNGNPFIGTGHNAIATDLAGQDWIVYHAIDRADPYLTGTEGINERPMLLDRLDWVGGWPYVRADRGPSANRQPGPATGGRWTTNFTSGIGRQWAGRDAWRQRSERDAGAYALSTGAGRLTSGAVGTRVRVEADLRSRGAAYGLTARVGASRVDLRIDPARGMLRLTQRRAGRLLGGTTTTLPAGVRTDRFHAVALEIRGGRATANVSYARLGDPVATARLDLRGPAGARIDRAGALAGGRGVSVDNLSVLPAYRPVQQLVRERVPDRLVAESSDEFDGAAPEAGWTWVRRDANATVSGGALRWPVQAADLTGTGNDAGVLLRDLGDLTDRSWTAETKLTIDLGEDDVRNFQQGGLVAYVTDDLFARFSHVAIFNTRQTEFGKEMPYAGRLSYGGTIVGPPAETTWLRLTHRVDPGNGERELRAWSSRDGRTWVRGGVWTLPKGVDLKIGLISHGRRTDNNGAQATSRFDYFRVYR